MASLRKTGLALAAAAASMLLAGCASQGATAQPGGAVVPACNGSGCGPAVVAPAPMPAENACKNHAACKAPPAPNACRSSNGCKTVAGQ